MNPYTPTLTSRKTVPCSRTPSQTPVQFYHEFTRCILSKTGCSRCRLEVYDPSMTWSVTFCEDDRVDTRQCTANSLVYHWMHIAPHMHYAIDQNASSMRQELPDEWKAVQEIGGFQSYLSFRIGSPNRNQPIWGTLTLAHPAQNYFNGRIVGRATNLIDEFRNIRQMEFLTAVCRTISQMQHTDSLQKRIDLIHEFYMTHAPALAVSVAVRRPIDTKTATMFIDQGRGDADNGNEPNRRHNAPSLCEVTLDLENNDTMMRRMQDSGQSEPEAVLVPSRLENTRMQQVPVDLLKLLSTTHWTSVLYWAMPLFAPKAPSSMSYLRPSSQASSFVGMVYVQFSNQSTIGEVGPKLHCLSPFFAHLLDEKLPRQYQIMDIIRQCWFMAPEQQQPQPQLPRIKNITSEVTEKILHLLKKDQEIRTIAGNNSNALTAIQLETVISDDSSSCTILKGETRDKRAICAKVMPVSKAVTRRHSVSRLRLELAICCCVSHPNILQSRSHQVAVPGHQLMERCGPCVCSEDQKSKCGRHQIEKALTIRALPGNIQSSLWDIMIMDYCERGTLYSMIHRRCSNGECCAFRKERETSALDLMPLVLTLLELAKALEYLHDNGMVHGDFKPENVLIVQQHPPTDVRGWSVKVTDFGTSRVLGYEEHRRPPEGTPVYAPPEVLCKEQFMRPSHENSIAGDVYAFGITMWEMMEAKIPFRDIRSRYELQEHVAKRNQRPKLTVACPPTLEKLMTACWHHSISNRPNCKVIVDELDTIFESLS